MRKSLDLIALSAMLLCIIFQISPLNVSAKTTNAMTAKTSSIFSIGQPMLLYCEARLLIGGNAAMSSFLLPKVNKLSEGSNFSDFLKRKAEIND